MNVVGVVILASPPPRDPIRANAASGSISGRYTRAAQQQLCLPGQAIYGGVVDWIDSTTAWCLWWRIFADRASPVCVVEKEQRKKASKTGQQLRAN
jgi:hypothetical protein